MTGYEEHEGRQPFSKSQRRRVSAQGVLTGEATPDVEVKPASTPARIPVTNAHPARLIVRKTASGEVYVFAPGSTVSVLAEDVPSLMAWNSPGERRCCGGGERIYFVIR